MSLTLLVSVFALAVLGYLAVLVALYLGQARLIYYPSREVGATPAAVGLGYETVTLTSGGGVRVAGWYVPGPDPGGMTLLFCHGNAGNIAHRLDALEFFHRLGLAVFIFDYRGYGRSQGRPSEEGLYADAEAAWEHLVGGRGVEPKRIVVYGRSLGAAVAAYLAGRHRPAGLILDSAFTSVADMAAAMYPIFPVRFLVRHRYDTLAALGRVRCPVLVIHSRDDELIPFSHGQRLYDAARDPKHLVVLAGGHNRPLAARGEVYRREVAAFLASLLPR